MQIKESTYNILNNAVSYPAFIVDSELNILYKNNSAEKLFKSDNGNLVLGNNFYSLIQKGIDYLSRQKSESYDIEDYFLFENKNYQITVVNIEEDQNYFDQMEELRCEVEEVETELEDLLDDDEGYRNRLDSDSLKPAAK